MPMAPMPAMGALPVVDPATFASYTPEQQQLVMQQLMLQQQMLQMQMMQVQMQMAMQGGAPAAPPPPPAPAPSLL